MKAARCSACLLLLIAAAPSFCLTPACAADPEVVTRLEQIVELRGAEAELQRQLATEGQSDEGVAEIALCRARMDLALELGRQADVVMQLQQILSIRQTRLQRAKAMLADTISTRQALRKMEIEILQAEIDLRRAERTAK